MKAAFSSCSELSALVSSESGARDSVSAITSCFPGTWVIENEYCIIRSETSEVVRESLTWACEGQCVLNLGIPPISWCHSS